MPTVAALTVGTLAVGAALGRGPLGNEEGNPACWTDGFSYAACCGDRASSFEAGCFEFDDSEVLNHPWTYERCCQPVCSEDLAARIRDQQDTCQDLLEEETTVVTGLWDLHREHWAPHARYSEGAGRGFDRYLSWLDALVLKPQALVLFIEEEHVAGVRLRRRELGLERKTCVVGVDMMALPQARLWSEYRDAHSQNRLFLPEETTPEVLYPEYTIVVNSKPELLACVAFWNPFSSRKFAWVDAGAGRKPTFPKGQRLLDFPDCPPWSLCVGRRMWLLFDFRDKWMRLKHGSTFDSTVLLGSREGVLLYGLWFQWAIARYLSEGVMDDEQSIIAEVWWDGRFRIFNFFGMTWDQSLAQMVRHNSVETSLKSEDLVSVDFATSTLGSWWGEHPSKITENNGFLWIPFPDDWTLVQKVRVNETTDSMLERLVFAMYCVHRRFDYYEKFCQAFEVSGVFNAYEPGLRASDFSGLEGIPVLSRGNGLVA